MSHIQNIIAREILDSRGNPTVEVDVELSDGSLGRASVPSGASTGTHEALELRDGDSARYDGLGVLKAVAHINTEIKDALLGLPADQQRVIDQRMIDLDGTANKSRLGANAILGVSLAVAHAAAESADMPLFQYLRKTFRPDLPEEYILPVPMINMVNGGKHADSNLDFQEFIVMPVTGSTFRETMRMSAQIFHALGAILKENKISTNVGNEGGYAGYYTGHAQVLQLLTQAIERAGFTPGVDVYLGMDIAAGSFYAEPKYLVTSEKSTWLREEYLLYIQSLMNRFPILSIEDPLFEDDWEGWVEFTKKHGRTMQIVGDDFLVTNVRRIQKAVEKHACNAVLIKLNQIGTLSETVDAILMTQNAGWRPVVSHRSGETEDTTIADLVVALNCGQIKTGSVSRSERVAKYNRLMRIEEELGENARYLGRSTFSFL